MFSPSKCFNGLGSGIEVGAGLLVSSGAGGIYHLFLSYFCIIKSLILCSSLESGSGGELEFHKPSHVFLQNYYKTQKYHFLWFPITILGSKQNSCFYFII